MENERLSRASMLKLAGLAAGAAGVGGWEAGAATGGPAAVEAGLVGCVLAPEQTEGPFYIPRERLRHNITEGRAGTPLFLLLTVVDTSTCRAIKGAAVDLWHADAAGIYSGFGSGSGSRTFMRGVQKTDSRGLAIFQTVYPGGTGKSRRTTPATSMAFSLCTHRRPLSRTGGGTYSCEELTRFVPSTNRSSALAGQGDAQLPDRALADAVGATRRPRSIRSTG